MSATANFRTIADDAFISLLIGGPWNGTVNPYPAEGLAAAPAGTPTQITGNGSTIQGLAKSFGHKEMLEKLNVKGIGDPRKRNRYHSFEGQITLDTFVPATGYVLPVTAMGCYISVIYNPCTGFGTQEVYTGVITDWQLTVTEGQEQQVNVTIDLDPDYIPLAEVI